MAEEVEEYQEPDYPAWLGKAPTVLQARFAAWLKSDAVGYDPASAKTKVEAFDEGVRLGVALRIPYQASEHNRAATAEERAAKRAEVEQRAAAKEQTQAEEAPAPKPAAKKAAKKAAPAPAPASTPAQAPAAKRPPARRAPARRAAAPAAAAEAPF